MSIDVLIKRARADILAMKAYASARSIYKDNDGMVFLDANEAPFEPYIGSENLSRYPHQQPDQLMDSLCRLYDVSGRNMAVTRGADEGIDILIRSFCNSGQDNIIVCPPSFAMYEHSAALHNVGVSSVPLTDDFDVDCDGVIEAADGDTKIIFLCSPNNPTGTLIAQDDVVSLCESFDGKALIVVDETYIEYSSADSFVPLLDRYDNLFILRTLSKAYAAAGLRCGAVIAHAEIIALLLKMLPPYPIAASVIKDALRILEPANLKRLADRRADILLVKDWFVSVLLGVDDVVKIISSDANFILVQVRDADAFYQRCLAGGIIIRNQSHQASLQSHVRISIGTREEMERLLAVINGEKAPDIVTGRQSTICRNTNETRIAVSVNLDRSGPVEINTGVGFYDHMLDQIAKHGGFALQIECDGDLDIDPHHTIEDCAIALGQALREALGDKRGIGRFGFTVPMDETLAQVALDLSGRFYLDFEADFPAEMVGDLPVDMVKHIFHSLAENLQANIHIQVKGENTHHMVEACFKAFGRALRGAIRIEDDALPSTKGVL